MTSTPTRSNISRRTRLFVISAAFILCASILGATAYMQTRKEQLPNAPLASAVLPDERESHKAPKSAVAQGAEAPAETVLPANDTAPSPTVVGTCETVGPIEVESSGGTAATVPTAYATLAAAFTAINGGTAHTGTITIDVCGNTTETGSAVLNQVAGVTSVTIAPAGSIARTISGAIVAGSPLIDFNGADNVTIDGLNTGGNSLTISNTTASATTGTSTIQFRADATSNTVTNCALQTSSLVATGISLGGAVVFGTGTTTGNDNITISNNNIGPAGANLPIKLISSTGSTGTAAIANSNITINNNNIFDFFGIGGASVRGIEVNTGNDLWTISNNRIYQTAARTFTTTALRYAGIMISSAAFPTSFTITGNVIGFGAANGTGTTTISGSSNEFRGLDIPSVGTTTATSIQNNTISGINQTSSRASTTTSSSNFIGMVLGTTGGLFNVGNVTGNKIGSLDGSSSIVIAETSTTASTVPVLGIYDFSFSNNNISNNQVGTITINNGGTGTTVGFRGIFVSGTTGQSVTLNNNTIGGTAAGSITDNIVGSYAMYGIQTVSTNISATGNTIRNMSSAANGSGLIVMSGIIASGSTGNNTISQNTIHSLSNASGAVANSIYGMSLSLPTATNLIERNFIHSLSLTSTLTGTQIWGISSGATGTATYQNNMIRLGIDAAGNSVTLPSSIIGIRDAAGATNQFYHNTVYIGGTGVLATPTASNSYCFFSDVVTVTRSFQDNIFWNARSNAVAGGVAHIATRVGGTAANPAGLTSNYNVLYFTGTDGATGVFNAAVVSTLAAWRTATGQDANSLAADPQLIAPNGTAATVDLHIHPTNPTPIESSGLAIGTVTNDFDGQTRVSLTPTDIGADAGNFVALDISGPTITYTALSNTTSTANRTLTISVTDASGVPTSGLGLPVVYFRKGAAGAYTSTQCSFVSGNSYNCLINYSLVTGGSVAPSDTIQYYVAAQDNVGNVAVNPAGGASGLTANPPAAATPPTTPSSYQIVTALTGTKTVCATGCDFATLTGAAGIFNALNTGVATGNISIEIGGDLTAEDGTNGLNPLTEEPTGSNFTVKLFPTGVARAITGTNTGALIRLNAADRVTLDGSIGGTGTGRSLTITNTNTGATSAVVWLQSNGADGATSNTIKNLNVTGSGNTQTLVGIGSGSSTISITSAGTGNNNNTVQNNSISKTQYGIYTGGASAANKNTGNSITQNLINTASPNNVATGGILALFENGIQITQNDIGNLLKHDGTSGTTGTVFGIALGLVPSNTVTTFTGSDVTNASITRNKISALTQLNSTGYSSFGIVVNSVTSGTTLVANNVLSQIRSAATASDFSAGIVAGGGTGSTTQIYFNSVSMTGSRNAASFPSYALALGGSNPLVDVRNNILYNTQTSSSTGKSYAIGLAYAAPYTNLTSDFNDLFTSGTTAAFAQTGGLGTTGTDRTSLAAWRTETGKDANSISADPLFTSTTDLHITGLASPVNNVGTPGTGTTSDYDNDTRNATTPDIGADELITVAFSSATYSDAEDNTTTITVTRTSGAGAAATVNYATSDGTATGSVGSCSADYMTATGTLNFAAGDTSKTFTVALCDDGTYEPSETVNLTLSNATGDAVLGSPAMAVLTIINANLQPVVTISNLTQAEGNTGQTDFTYTLTKTGATAVNATVNYNTVSAGPNPTATAGAACGGSVDYIQTSGSVTFLPNETTKQIIVKVCGDTVYEQDESYYVNITNNADATADGTGGNTIIQNDDTAPTIALDNVTHNEGDSGTTSYVFTVTKTGATALSATVDFATMDGTATVANNDYQANSGTLTFAASDTTQQITVLVNGDTTVEPDETFTVHLANAAGATITTADGTGTITNDDANPDYTVATTGGAIVVTDVTGNGDTLAVSEPAAGQIKFAAAGRIFAINGTTFISGDSGNLALTGVNSITINQGAGADILNVGAFTNALPSLSVNGDAGDDAVNFNGSINFAPDANLDANLQNDTATPGTDTVTLAPGARLVAAGAGAFDVRASRNVTIGAGAKLQTQNGALTVEANQQTSATTGDFDGVNVSGGTVQTTGTGNLNIKGTGGAGDFTANVGVLIAAGGIVQTTGTGLVTVTGTGGAGTGSATAGESNLGVNVSGTGSRIESAAGAIQITGQGGATNSSNSVGVVVDGNGKVQTSGAGPLTINGTGGNVTGGSTTFVNSGGVFIVVDENGAGGTIASTGTGANAGNIMISGQSKPAGNGAGEGIRVDAPSTVTTVDGALTFAGSSAACNNACLGTSIRGPVVATGTGAVNITGTGAATTLAGAPVHGVNLRSGGSVSTHDGDINITGTGGSGSVDNIGFALAPNGTGTLQTNGTGQVFINADTIRLNPVSATISVGSNAVTLRQQTNGTAINLGSGTDSTANTVELANAELNRITAGTINVGNANSGPITVSANITRATATALNLTSGANIDIAGGALNSAGGHVALNPATYTFPSASGVDVNTGVGTLTLAAAKGLQFVINNGTVDTGYTQLNVAGLINLNGANLALSGTHVPAAGQSFNLVNNDGADAITGTFNGLPEGAVITNFLGSGRSATISYVGGDGNDAVLTVNTPTFAIDNVTQAEGDSGTTTFTFTVTKTGTGAAAVDYTTVDGTATTADQDYQANSGTLTFAASDTTQQITVLVNGDTRYEGDETFTVHLANAAGAAITTADGTGTITNDDAPIPVLVVNTTDDVDNGFCLPSHCSLREAINAANIASGAHAITFNIPTSDAGFAAGVFTIKPLNGEYALTGGMTTIDGSSQTGFTGNTNTSGPEIVIDGSLNSCGAFTCNGFTINSANNNIFNLGINHFTAHGINMFGASANNIIRGCYIGTDPTGTIAAGNGAYGINSSGGNTIGGLAPGEGNLISGNGFSPTGNFGGIALGTGDTVQGNFIGTDAAGTSALANKLYGIVANSGGQHLIERNVISGNTDAGLAFFNTSEGNTITNNKIGTDAAGTGALGNGGHGIELCCGAGNNTIGGTNGSTANVIAYNGGAGVVVHGVAVMNAARAASPAGRSNPNEAISGGTGANGNRISGNSIHDNKGLGIDLGADGVTPNDPQDTDSNLDANNLQNFPVITGVFVLPTDNTVNGTINSTPNTHLNIEFFGNDSCHAAAPNDYGEGQSYLGQTDVTTDNNGDAAFAFHPPQLSAGQFVTATATDDAGNTSEFSQCSGAGATGDINFTSPSTSVLEDTTVGAQIMVTRTGGSSGAISATFDTSDDTATAGADYTAVNNYTVSFADGETGSKIVTVPIIDDKLAEGDETVTLTLTVPTLNRPAGTNSHFATLVIIDNEPHPTINIGDTFVAEPPSGTATAQFTVSLSNASASTVTVDYQTSDGTATAPDDYVAITPQTLTFLSGETVKTINVTVNADALTEGNEDFFIELNNPNSAATLGISTGTATITDPIAPKALLISEFRFRGVTFSAGQSIFGDADEFIELFNNTNAPVTVATTDGSAGWTIAALNASGTSALALVTIPAGTVIPARGHYLAVNSLDTTTLNGRRGAVPPNGGYSLNNYAVGDDFYTQDVADDAGVAVFTTADPLGFTNANRLDAVGFNAHTGATADLFREGAGLQSPGANDGEYAFVRKMVTGLPQDTDDNAADFVFISTAGASYGGVPSVLGAPGPENCGCRAGNLFTGSPVQRNAQLKTSLIEPQQISTSPPNRIRNNSAVGPNATFGTLEIRRRFTNTTGAGVTKLRFRVVDTTTLGSPNPGGVQADVRWLSTTDLNVTTSRGNLTLKGITIEVPPAQNKGGGLNASGIVAIPGGTLAPGAPIDVRFLLGVEANGRYRFLINVEALL